MINNILKKLSKIGWRILVNPTFKGTSGLYHSYKYVVFSKNNPVAIEEEEIFDNTAFIKCIGKSIDTHIPIIAVCGQITGYATKKPEIPFMRIILKSSLQDLENIIEEMTSKTFEWL